MSVHNFPPGTYVQNQNNSSPFIGTVTGISANTFGEPVLVIDMVIMSSPDDRLMQDLGWAFVGQAWHKTQCIHPNNVQLLQSDKILQEDR